MISDLKVNNHRDELVILYYCPQKALICNEIIIEVKVLIIWDLNNDFQKSNRFNNEMDQGVDEIREQTRAEDVKQKLSR